MIQFYGYKKCGTSRKAEAFLGSKGVNFKFIDVTIDPPNVATLKKISKLSGIPAKKMFNTSGVSYREGNFKDRIQTMSDDSIFQELAADGRLIKRPLVTDGKHATVGYDEEALLSFV